MMTFCKLFLITIAMAATGMGAFAADPKPDVPAAAKTATASAANTDLQKLIEQFKTRRDALLASHDALLNQLKNATEEQKKAILEKMQAQQKDLMDAQRALGRQLRDEMRKLRQLTPPGSGRH